MTKWSWGALGAIAGAVAAAVAVLEFLHPGDETVIVPSPVVPISVGGNGSDEFGFEVRKVYLGAVYEHSTYEKVFWRITRPVKEGFNYELEVVLRKFDDREYRNCEVSVPGYGLVYYGVMHINSLVGVVNDRIFTMDLKKGQYRLYFTLVGPEPRHTTEQLARAKFQLNCDSMATIDHDIDISRHSEDRI